MKKLIIPLAALCIVNVQAADNDQAVRCNFVPGGDGGCTLVWQLQSQDGTQFKVETFDNGSWRGDRTGAASYSAEDQASTTMRPGKFHRVLQCRGKECASSKVVWSPSLADVADIPDTLQITDSDGEVVPAIVVKADFDGTPKRSSTIRAQYNMLLATDAVNSMRKAKVDIPAMEKPVTGRPKTDEEIVLYNVYEIYERYRAMR